MIEIINRQKKHPIRTKTLKRHLEELITHYGLGEPEIALVFVGSQAIRTLNRKFLKKDKPTDVLSFPIGETGADGNFYLGDIVIGVPVADKQSRQKGHSLEKELKFLILHGFLHLLGYDHSAGIEEQERIMMKRLELA